MSTRITLLTASVILLAGAVPALAADHQLKVGEVLLSKNGSTASQFVELQDPGEPFPSPPYSIQLFGADGNSSLGSQTLTIPAGTTRFLLATPQAATDFGVTAQATLTLTLPTNGQLCFNRGTFHIHCLSWGTITTPVIGATTSNTGPSPTDGMSLQLVGPSLMPFVAAPTPGAVNSNGMVDMPMIDAPPLPDAGTPNGMDAGGNPTKPVDNGGCNAGAGASWLAFVGLAALVLVRRSSTRVRR